MKDTLQQDGVGAAAWDHFEEAAGNEPAAAGDAEPIEMRARVRLAAREVESNALEMRVALEHAADQFAGAAADIMTTRAAAKSCAATILGTMVRVRLTIAALNRRVHSGALLVAA